MSSSPKVEAVAAQILTAFEAGTVPSACAQIFIRHKNSADCPSAKWSWRNQLTAALAGHYDARGFRQWQQVGRNVKKGEHAFYILGPFMVKDRDAEPQEESALRLVGFTAIPVFGYIQTEGEPLPGHEEEEAFIDSLPLVGVARAWNLTVATFNAEGGTRLGSYRSGKSIALGVENLSTWTHELVHAADDRRGTLTRSPGQDLGNEVVAEFGGAILLEALGYSVESDRGGAYRYIQSYAKEAKRDVLSVCTQLLDRACGAVSLILTAAEQLQQDEAA
ncbi:MAG TPA: ArdC family protein [Thermoanaerobaculia bacterium]|nr:ArdC family protein [Thermoanaerobaculia bacterium]